jgi:hypothetical protein
VLFYFDQAARFVAPAASLLLVYSATGIAAFLEWAWRSLAVSRRGAGLIPNERSAAT